MNKTYIALIVLVLLVIAFVIIGKGNVEAPVLNVSNDSQNNNQGETNVTPSPSATIGAVKEFTVIGKNFAFEPSLITVKKGDRVKITFKNDVGFHDFVIDEFGAATKQTQAPTTEVIEFTANKTGTFEYYCSVGSHRTMGMKGTLVVK
jgi:plastocyanin